jgi:hypothetical protein
MKPGNTVRHSPNPPAPPSTPSDGAGPRGRRVVLAAVTMLATLASAGLSACATADHDATSPDAGDTTPVPAPGDDSGVPADADASPPCAADCEFFPPACSAEILCPNGLFAPAGSPAGPNHFDGRTLIHLVRGRSASDVWAVGSAGALTHFNGTSWVRSELPADVDSPRGRIPALRALWLRDQYEVGFNGLSGRTYSRGLMDPPDAGADSGGWTEHGPPLVSEAPPFIPSAQSVKYGWAAPGSEWLWLATEASPPGPWNPTGLVRLRMTAPGILTGDATAVGAGVFVGLHGASADELWAVGMDGVAVHVTGASGESPTVKAYNSRTRNALYGVWAGSESDVWAVGYNGTIRHYVGDPLLWEIVSDVPTGVHLNAVWGSSASDIWAVGKDAVVLHYDGTRWSRMKVGGLGSRRPDLVTVWTSDPEHVWVGGDGVVLSLGGKP